MNLFKRLSACIVFLTLVAVMSGCHTFAFRNPVLVPQDIDRVYSVSGQRCYEGTLDALSELSSEFESTSYNAQRELGMLVTSFQIFPEQGDNDLFYLERVAYSQGAPWEGGRYQFTVTTLATSPQNCFVQVVSRIEGYLGEEMGYQVLTTRGLLEEHVFELITAELGQ